MGVLRRIVHWHALQVTNAMNCYYACSDCACSCAEQDVCFMTYQIVRSKDLDDVRACKEQKIFSKSKYLYLFDQVMLFVYN